MSECLRHAKTGKRLHAGRDAPCQRWKRMLAPVGIRLGFKDILLRSKLAEKMGYLLHPYPHPAFARRRPKLTRGGPCAEGARSLATGRPGRCSSPAPSGPRRWGRSRSARVAAAGCRRRGSPRARTAWKRCAWPRAPAARTCGGRRRRPASSPPRAAGRTAHSSPRSGGRGSSRRCRARCGEPRAQAPSRRPRRCSRSARAPRSAGGSCPGSPPGASLRHGSRRRDSSARSSPRTGQRSRGSCSARARGGAGSLGPDRDTGCPCGSRSGAGCRPGQTSALLPLRWCLARCAR
mmetsp:Transcript_108785/g.304009  ORF Transcript_108785/g.304009 Transcript_108785/m.304009 type:complete len:292 (-) Transcript_108785:641-1516(-)